MATMTPDDLDARSGPVEQQTRMGPMIQPPKPSSEATHVEQQRAIAQVQGALVVAQQRPRDELKARTRLEQACQIMELAEHAFFRFPRSGEQISGPSIHLATEMARCWGNIDYGVFEMRRDDINDESEMMTYAWDLETNSRAVTSFIVPHFRDKKGGPEPLVTMRDIYENNANAGARRLRECIFRVLPKSFVEYGKRICMETLQAGGGVPIEERRAKLLEAFAGIDVSRAQIEKKAGVPADRLSGFDIGVLGTVYQSIKRGETTVRQEFAADEAGEIAQDLIKKEDTTGEAGKTADKPKSEPRKSAASPAAKRGSQPADGPQTAADANEDPASETSGAPGGETSLPLLSSPPTAEEIANLIAALPDYLAALEDDSAVLEFTNEFDPVIFSVEKVDCGAADQMEAIIKGRLDEVAEQ